MMAVKSNERLTWSIGIWSLAGGARSGAGIAGATAPTAFTGAGGIAGAVADLACLDHIVATDGRRTRTIDLAEARAAIGVRAIAVFAPFADIVATDRVGVGEFRGGNLVLA